MYSASISIRKGTGATQAEAEEKRNYFNLLLLASLCHTCEPGQRKQRHRPSTCTSTKENKYFLSADKQTIVSSPIEEKACACAVRMCCAYACVVRVNLY